MRHQKQPTNRSCGPTCVAMLVGEDAEVLINEIGNKLTHGPDLKQALWRRDCTSSRTLRATKDTSWETDLEPRIVLKTGKRDGKTLKHWVVVYQGHVYDPAFNNPVKVLKYMEKYMVNARFTSFFRVTRPLELRK